MNKQYYYNSKDVLHTDDDGTVIEAPKRFDTVDECITHHIRNLEDQRQELKPPSMEYLILNISDSIILRTIINSLNEHNLSLSGLERMSLVRDKLDKILEKK